MMIRECNLKAKPVITATQMLESMITSPMPTRAEVSDVANAIYDGTSCVMLSGETAVGKWPIKTVETMSKIIQESEKDFNNEGFFYHQKAVQFQDVSSAVALSSVETCYSIQAKAIAASSRRGHMIRRIAKYHPKAMIIGVTPLETTYHQMSIMWGVKGILDDNKDIEESLANITATSLKNGWLEYGDLFVMTAGNPYGKSYTTNSLLVESVGRALVRGRGMQGEALVEVDSFEGEIELILTADKNNLKDKIVVITKCCEEDLNRLKEVKGIILQNHPFDESSEVFVQKLFETYKIPFIVRADGATSLLHDGDKVRFYPSKGLVFASKELTEEEIVNKIAEKQ